MLIVGLAKDQLHSGTEIKGMQRGLEGSIRGRRAPGADAELGVGLRSWQRQNQPSAPIRDRREKHPRRGCCGSLLLAHGPRRRTNCLIKSASSGFGLASGFLLLGGVATARKVLFSQQ